MSKRQYSDTIHLKKAHVGNKSVNLVVDSKEATRLVRVILNASEGGRNFDLTTYYTRKRKSDGTISMTVTRGQR